MTHYVQPQPPDRSQLVVVPLKNSAALRNPAYGGKGGQSGALVDPSDNRIILSESSIEKKTFKTFLADRHVKTLREQAAVIPFLDEDGEPHTHIIDAIVERRDGGTIGVLGKSEDSAAKHNLIGFAERLAAQTPKSVAHRLQVVTSRNLPEWHVQNSSLILSVRRDNRTPVDNALRELAPSLTKPIRIGKLSRLLGGGQIAFRPIVRALHYGTLTFLGLGRIDINSKVVFSGTVEEDTDRFGPIIDPQQEQPAVFRRPKKVPPKKPRASHRKR